MRSALVWSWAFASAAGFGVAALAGEERPRSIAAESDSPGPGVQRRMAYEEGAEVEAWQRALRAKLLEILAMPDERAKPLDAKVALDAETDEHVGYRVSFRAETGVVVPGYLLKPKDVEPPFPVMICLQGHTKDGMAVSIGRAPVKGGRDFALQAVRNGWAALAIEQRSFGERAGNCQSDALHGVLLGRPLTGQRVYDVMRAIDFIETQRDLDAQRIGCMGNSMGGTVSFYAACVDPRLRLAVVSCSYCTYADSWLKHRHCACGYLPGIAKYADMGDLGGLIAPRNLVVVAGRHDAIADLSGVREAFSHTRRVYEAAGAGENAALVVGDEGHQFYPDLAWPVIARMAARFESN